jgi:hypothetical protein
MADKNAQDETDKQGEIMHEPYAQCSTRAGLSPPPSV